MPSSLKAIKEIRKKYEQGIKASAKKLSWKFKSPYIFKVENNFYIDASFHMHSSDKIFGSVRLKPLFLDEIYWKIIGHDSLPDQPLSLRSVGWSAAKPIHFDTYEITLSDEVTKDIEQFFLIVNSKTVEILEKYKTVDDYIATLKLDPGNTFNVINLLSTFVYLQDAENVNALIKQCRDNKINSGVHSDGKDFYDMVEEYVDKQTGLSPG